MLHLYPEKVRKAEIRDFDTPFEQFKPYLLHEKTSAIKGSRRESGVPILCKHGQREAIGFSHE